MAPVSPCYGVFRSVCEAQVLCNKDGGRPGLDSLLNFLLWLVIISGAPTSLGGGAGGQRDGFDCRP